VVYDDAEETVTTNEKPRLMLIRRKHRKVPSLNTTSTADISFMLLIFFLVTTSMDQDKGMTRQLPPMDDKQQEEVVDVDKRNVMALKITAENELLVNDSMIAVEQLSDRVVDFVSHCPDRKKHVITLDVSRVAKYNTYFAVQNEIVTAYNKLRDAHAYVLYHHDYAACSPDEREVVRKDFPQRIAENYQPAETQEGGGV
jgi:biopolymer transport protein ExbD